MYQFNFFDYTSSKVYRIVSVFNTCSFTYSHFTYYGDKLIDSKELDHDQNFSEFVKLKHASDDIEQCFFFETHF